MHFISALAYVVQPTTVLEALFAVLDYQAAGVGLGGWQLQNRILAVRFICQELRGASLLCVTQHGI